MSTTHHLVFPCDRSPQRLDSFLALELPDISRAQLQKLIADKQVRCNGTEVKAGYKLKGGEEIVLHLPAPQPLELIAQPIALHILYEDQDVVVINKDAGMVVHPAAGHARDTLVNALLHHCSDLAGIGGILRPGIVHRLDKDTSGVLVISKNDLTHQHLARQFSRHSVNRCYLALIHGILPTTTGTIDQPLGRHPVQRKKISSKARHGKRAVTHWTTLASYPRHNLSLVRLQLETGRTHQIRVHLSERGHPLVGDPLYGKRSERAAIKDPQLLRLVKQLPGQALHAAKLGFVHPRSDAYLEFNSDIPPAFNAIILYLQQH